MNVFKIRTAIETAAGEHVAPADVFVAAKTRRSAVKTLAFWKITARPGALKLVSAAKSNNEIKRLARESEVVWRRPGKTGALAAHNTLACVLGL